MNPFDRVSSTTPPRRAGSAAFLLWRTSQVAGGGGSQRLKVFAEVKLAKPVLKSLSLCCFSCQQRRRRQQTPVHCAFSMMLPRIFFGQVQILMDEPDAVEFSSNLLILLF
jgi:hypothetical protein